MEKIGCVTTIKKYIAKDFSYTSPSILNNINRRIGKFHKLNQ